MRPIQLIRLTKSTGAGVIWLNPQQIIFAEQTEKKEDKSKLTVIHVTGKEKLFVKESPEELNKIFRSIKADIKIEY